MKRRLADPFGLSSSTVALLAGYTGEPNPKTLPDLRLENNHGIRCVRCKESGKLARKSNLTKERCEKCKVPVCGKHGKSVGVICMKCLE